MNAEFQESLDRQEVDHFLELHRDVEFRKSLSRGSVDPPLAIAVDTASESPSKEVAQIDPAARMTVNQLVDYTCLVKDVPDGQEHTIAMDVEALEDLEPGAVSPSFSSPVKQNTTKDGKSQEPSIQNPPAATTDVNTPEMVL